MTGIDGLYLVGHTLLAVQNGVTPERVVRLDLDEARSMILAWHPIESNSAGLGDPTHGVVVGRRFYFIANSGWDHFNEDGTPKANVAVAPPVLHAPVSTTRRSPETAAAGNATVSVEAPPLCADACWTNFGCGALVGVTAL